MMIVRLVLMVVGLCSGFALNAVNLAQDADFRTDNLGGVVGWTCIRPQTDRAEILDERGPDGGHAVRLMLDAKGGFNQPELKYVNNEPYRMGAWVRTKGLKPGNVSLIAYDNWLHINVKSEAFPPDTNGEWVKVEWEGKMFVNIKKAMCYLGVFAKEAMGPGEVLDVADPYLVALSEGRHELVVRAFDGTSPVATNRYAITVVRHPERGVVCPPWWCDGTAGHFSCAKR